MTALQSRCLHSSLIPAKKSNTTVECYFRSSSCSLGYILGTSLRFLGLNRTREYVPSQIKSVKLLIVIIISHQRTFLSCYQYILSDLTFKSTAQKPLPNSRRPHLTQPLFSFPFPQHANQETPHLRPPIY
jgi:hypothetical protein